MRINESMLGRVLGKLVACDEDALGSLYDLLERLGSESHEIVSAEFRLFLRKQELLVDQLVARLGGMSGVERLLAGEPAISMVSAAARFVAREKFVIDISPHADDAKVQISGLGDNFRNWCLPIVEESTPAIDLSSFTLFTLDTLISDRDIIAKIGGVKKAIVSLADIKRKMEKQPHGPDSPVGKLLENGTANIFYVLQPVARVIGNQFIYTNLNGAEVPETVTDPQYLLKIGDHWHVLRAVCMFRDGGGWYVDALPVVDQRRWNGCSRVFYRNFSVLGPSASVSASS